MQRIRFYMTWKPRNQYWDNRLKAWMPNTWLKGVGSGFLKLSIAVFAVCFFTFAVTQIDLTTQVKGKLPEVNGGTNQSTYTLGDLLYASATNTLSKLAGNITGTKNLLCQTGTGSVSAAPVWCTLVAGDIPSLDAAKISTGTLATARLGSGTANSTTYLRGDQTWATVPSAVNFADAEVPTGTIDGANTVFTLAHTPSPAASLHCDKNGQVMYAGGADYTLATATITYTAGAVPKSGDVHECSYRY